MNFDLSLGYGVLVKAKFVDNKKLTIKYEDSYDSNIDMASKFRINTLLTVLEGVVEGALETIFDRGISFDNIFNETALCWLDLSQIYFMPEYTERYQWAGLTLGYWTKYCPGDIPWGPWTTKPIGEQIKQIVGNIVGKIEKAMNLVSAEENWEEELQLFLTQIADDSG